MKKILVSAALVLSLLSVPAFAKGKPAGRGNKKHDEKSEKWKDKEKDHKKDWREHDRDREHGRVANHSRPPGWDKGKKTGWGNCDVPPGQAKKQGCGSTANHRTASHRPVRTTRYPKDRRTTYPTHRTYPTRRTYPTHQTGPTRQTTTPTTSTTSTTATTNPPKKGGHPFEPVMREKQQAAKTR